jgi:hypothetical protein
MGQAGDVVGAVRGHGRIGIDRAIPVARQGRKLAVQGTDFGTRPVPQTRRRVRVTGRRMHCKLVLDANDADRRTQPAKQARYIDQDARSRGRRASTLCRLGGHAATPVIQHVLQRLTPRRAGRPSQQLPRPRGIATDQQYIGGS